MKKTNTYKINWNRFTGFIVTMYTILLAVLYFVISFHTKQGEFMMHVTLWTWLALTGITLFLVNHVFDKNQE